MNDTRQLFSTEAERAVVGALLLDNGAYDRIADILKPADFYHESHRVLYKHLAEQISAGKVADVVTLIEALRVADDLERAGGVKYLEQILLNTPSSAGCRRYAETVVDRRAERALVGAAADLHDLAVASGSVDERLDKAQQLIFALTEKSARDEPRDVSTVMSAFIEQLEARAERGGELSGLASGHKDLDEKTDGFQAGNLIIVGGRPSMGKTALAMGWADHCVLHGGVALVFSMEMAAEEIVGRSISRLGRVSSHALRSGKLNSDQWDGVSAAVGRLHHKPLIIDDSAGLSVGQIRARARREKRKHNQLDLVVIDYLQLMSGNGDNRNEQLGEITRELKLMARELKCPVILLSQLSRQCEQRPDKRPVMSDLRESGAIEQDADVIMFVYRDEVYNPNTEYKGGAEILLRKHRNGEIGTVLLTWLGEYTSFENYTGRPPENAPVKQPARRAMSLEPAHNFDE